VLAVPAGSLRCVEPAWAALTAGEMPSGRSGLYAAVTPLAGLAVLVRAGDGQALLTASG
jgi:hypothetical protein